MPSAARCGNPKRAGLSGGVIWVSQNCRPRGGAFGEGSAPVLHSNPGSASSVGRQPLWAGNETALGSRPSRTAAGRGGRGSILDALWTREKPWSRSPQKPLFQLWRPASDHQPGAGATTTGAAVGATPGGGTPGSWWGGGSWVPDQGAGRREDVTRLGRRAMNGGRVIEPSCAGTVGTARLFLPVPLARHTYYSLGKCVWSRPTMLSRCTAVNHSLTHSFVPS